ncbi:ChrR family anti-sigma-E factor [Roseibium aggregatum]|uniref:Transcriptional regulator n=1 Tax=Roseibium aggregatum TaxID=187304 RepID=A0A926SA54_9HYPH|nr:ChrR family anti-sigma-E factor [Roseibium aggregatum]MBD1548334.1 transcriptional regulator [Roseibium aggregatum]
MSPRHHIRDELLAAYATGDLAEGWSLAVATHLALCPGCRGRLAKFEAAAGDMLEKIEPSEQSVDASWQDIRQRLSGQISSDRKPSGSVPSLKADKPRHDYVLPAPLRNYVGADADQLKWKSLGRGAYQVLVPTGDEETSVRLLRIPAGKPVPEHGHGGRELTLVLSGSFSDVTGRFSRGDLEDADETLEHKPVAGDEEDCICLAVTDAPLRFKSRLLRLVQPMLGI